MDYYLKLYFFIWLMLFCSCAYAEHPLSSKSTLSTSPTVQAEENQKKPVSSKESIPMGTPNEESGSILSDPNDDFMSGNNGVNNLDITPSSSVSRRSGSKLSSDNVKKGSELLLNRELQAGKEWSRNTIKENLQGMIDAYLKDEAVSQKRMAAEVQSMVDFLEQSMASPDAWNVPSGELTVNKRRDGSQVSTYTVMNRDGAMAILRIVYPKEGDVPANVTFRSGSIFREDSSISVEWARKYIAQYANLDGRLTAEETIAALRRDKKIMGSFHFSKSAPADTYMEISFSVRLKGNPMQKTLKIFGDGHVTVTEGPVQKKKISSSTEEMTVRTLHMKKSK